MRVPVRLCARLRDVVGAGELVRDAPAGATARQVWDALAADHPALAPYGTISSCAVNEEYAPFSTTLQDGDEVAFLPPVSGGERSRVDDGARGSGLGDEGFRIRESG